MNKSQNTAALYVAVLKAISIIHQQNHWVTKGYERHLMFERIYKSAVEDMDAAAEKIFALFGEECFDHELQSKLLYKVLSKYNKLSKADPVVLSENIEKDFLNFSKSFYDMLEKEGELTLGLDDLIMSIASNREEAIYLLKQSTTMDSSMKTNEDMMKELDKIAKDQNGLLKKFAQHGGITSNEFTVTKDVAKKLVAAMYDLNLPAGSVTVAFAKARRLVADDPKSSLMVSLQGPNKEKVKSKLVAVLSGAKLHPDDHPDMFLVVSPDLQNIQIV